MKNIVIFNEHWLSGGVESLFMNLISNITDNDLKITILVTQKESDVYDSFLAQANIKLISIFDKPIANPIIRTLKNSRGFKKKIKELNPDILHINSCNAYCLKLAYFAKKLGIKNVIVHSHNTEIEHDKLGIKEFAHRYWIKRFVKYPDYFFGCSTESLEFMYHSTDGHLVKNGVNLDRFKFDTKSREEIRKKHDILDEEIVLGHVGRFSNQKNHKFLIDIFDSYLKVNWKAKLLLVGEGELEEEIKDYVKEYHLDDKVIFVGKTSEVEKYYSAFDIFLLPSFHEGLPVVAIEAQASNLPTILSDKISKETKVNDDVSFISIDDAKLWVNEIEKYHNYKRVFDQEKLKSAGFDIVDSAKKLEDFYKNI